MDRGGSPNLSGSAVATSLTPNFTLNNVADGVHDLMVYRRPAAGAALTDRIGFQRDILSATRIGNH